MKLNLILSIFCLLLCPALYGEIVVSQDKNGKILITNEPTRTGNRFGKRRARRIKRKGVTYMKEPSSKVPAKYLNKIRKYAFKHGVDEKLIIAVARAESGFNQFAVSKKGAVGIMQLMRDTAIQYGVIDRYNADQNIDAGVRHLKYLKNKYNNDLPLVLAAYNAGEEAVKKYNGIPPYNETRTYIKRVMRFMGRSYGGRFNAKISTRIYQYRTKDGKTVITDSFPSNAVKGSVQILD